MAAGSATTLPVSAVAAPFDAPDVPLGGFVASTVDRDDWRAAPVPRDWVLEGTPLARFVPLARGRDGQASTTLWDCTAGTFRWHFNWDETVHILEGAVVVTMPSGEVHRLSAGSVAFFPAGSSAVWRVEGYVRKLAICRRAFPGPLATAISSARRMKRAVQTIGAVLANPLDGLVGVRARIATAALLVAGLGLDLAIDIV